MVPVGSRNYLWFYMPQISYFLNYIFTNFRYFWRVIDESANCPATPISLLEWIGYVSVYGSRFRSAGQNSVRTEEQRLG